MKNQGLLLYRFVSLALAASFGTVGLVFFLMSDRVLGFFNRLSPPLGLSPAPVQSGSFYPILAIGYMYLVTLLAGLMFKKPGNRLLPMLLAQGKLASSILSLLFFFGRAPYLICLANTVVDGGIGMLVLWLFSCQKRYAASWPT
jgi:hypothetical protein